MTDLVVVTVAVVVVAVSAAKVVVAVAGIEVLLGLTTIGLITWLVLISFAVSKLLFVDFSSWSADVDVATVSAAAATVATAVDLTWLN